MSHLHERKEKVCLNCGTQLAGRYCHVCGQENVEPKETFGHLTRHFLEDLTHFDGKFFVTIKHLLFRPGFLTSEYVKGRRASYLNPIRMYLFISALFFLIYMSFFVDRSNIIKETHTERRDTSTAREVVRTARIYIDSLAKAEPDYDSAYYNTPLPQTLKQYDSVQAALPAKERDGLLERYIYRKLIELKTFKQEHPGEIEHRFKAKFFHSLPYMLFLSVPLVALLLQLLYVRRRREFYYVSHVIFILHYYCTFFLLFLFIRISQSIGGYGKYVALILFLALGFYLYKAMRNFYHQRRTKTVLKFLIFGFLGSMVIGVLTLGLVINSLFNVMH